VGLAQAQAVEPGLQCSLLPLAEAVSLPMALLLVVALFILLAAEAEAEAVYTQIP
jgi:hypothetical protein